MHKNLRILAFLCCTGTTLLCHHTSHAHVFLDAPPEPGEFQFSGYWRAGFNTASPFTGREFIDGAGGSSFYNFIERLTSEAPDTQGVVNLKTSRHARDPNELKLTLAKKFSNDVKLVFSLDSLTAPVHEFVTPKNQSRNQSSALDAANSLRVRDLYVRLPTPGHWKVWGGARQFEFEDLRLFDSGSPFDTNTLGIGLESEHKLFAMGYAKAKREAVITGQTQKPRPANTTQQILVDTKDATFLYRHEIPLEDSSSLIPMARLIIHGSTMADEATGGQRQAIKGSQELIAGAILVRRNETSTPTGHSTVGVKLIPPDRSEAALRGDIGGFDMHLFAEDSNQFNFEKWGLLSALSVEQIVFRNAQNVFVVADDGSVLASGDTSKEQRIVALGLQSMYFATPLAHLGLDVSYSFWDKKLKKDQSNALLITPIVRFALQQTMSGSTQFYTSFTYGRYDLDFKRQLDGAFKSTLSTLQTGIEVWF